LARAQGGETATGHGVSQGLFARKINSQKSPRGGQIGSRPAKKRGPPRGGPGARGMIFAGGGGGGGPWAGAKTSRFQIWREGVGFPWSRGGGLFQNMGGLSTGPAHRGAKTRALFLGGWGDKGGKERGAFQVTMFGTGGAPGNNWPGPEKRRGRPWVNFGFCWATPNSTLCRSV